MKVLLDHHVPAQLKRMLPGHFTSAARQMRWERLKNGDLLAVAEAAGFEAPVTGDQSLFYDIPGLMVGLAGVGYGLLRAFAPNLVPSILSLSGGAEFK